MEPLKKFTSMRSSRVLGVALVLLIIAGLLRQSPQAPPAVGSQAPDFALQTLDGREVRLSDFRGQPIMINVWTSWCPYCLAEMPDVLRAYQSHKSDGLVLLGVNWTHADSLRDVQVVVSRFGLTYPVLLDHDGKWARLYGVDFIGMSFFIKRDGTIDHIVKGPMSADQIDAHVRRILQ